MARVVTVGADPELPIYQVAPKQPSKGKYVAILASEYINGASYVPVCGLMGGDKGSPKILDPAIGGWLEDGVMLELNPNASESTMTLAESINKLTAAADAELAKVDCKTRMADTAYYRTEDLAKHPKANEFGCASDLSAYDRGAERVCPMPEAMKEYGDNVRFAGGHIHVGVTDWPEELPKFIAIRFMDMFVGAPYISVRAAVNTERSRYYGLPGVYRETSYGIEYRTPCNKWLSEAAAYTPYTLGRAKLVGKIIAGFEDYKNDLVRLYNSVNWDMYYAAYVKRDWTGIIGAVDPAMFSYKNCVDVGPWRINILDVRDTKDNGGKKLPDSFDFSGKAPAKPARRSIDGWDRKPFRAFAGVSMYCTRQDEANHKISTIRGDRLVDTVLELIEFSGAVVTEVGNAGDYIILEFPHDYDGEFVFNEGE